jgi:tetratricopeptide (TPR) repeat protein
MPEFSVNSSADDTCNYSLFLFLRALAILLLIAFAVGVCSAQQTNEILPGKVIEKVECVGDPSQSYALYLPSDYDAKHKSPILYAFDPGARGSVPVQRFKDAAEKYGWIIVGSNNSRNGPWKVAVDAWNAMRKDTLQRFSVDDGRAYATGFSGGARVAVQIAVGCDCLAGVIGVGAGFPGGLEPAPSMHFRFYGLVGVDDFNFAELRSLEDLLAKAGLVHRIQIFEGGHSWPPASVAMTPVAWMELQAMKDQKRASEEALVESMWQQAMQQAKTFEDVKNYAEAYRSYVDAQQSFKSLRDVSDADKKVSQLLDSRELRTSMREEQEDIRRQHDLDQQIRALIARREGTMSNDGRRTETATESAAESGNEDFETRNRLAALLSDLHKRSTVADDPRSRRVARRTLEGLFVSFIEQGIGMLEREKRYAEAAKYFKLATEIKPDRAGAFYYLAWAYAVQGDKKRSLNALSAAVEKGFSDLAAISGNKAFDPIRSDQQYQKIIQRLKQ